MQRQGIEKRTKSYAIRLGRYQIRLELPRTPFTPSVLFVSAAIALIVLSFLTLSDPVLIDQDGRYLLGDPTLAPQHSLNKIRYLALGLLLLAVLRKPSLSASVLALNLSRSRSAALFFLLISLITGNSILMGSVSALLNSAILLIYAIAFLIVLSATEADRLFFYRFLAAAFFLYIMTSIILYWPPQYRWLGGIHPNIYAMVLIFFSAILLFMRKELKYLGIPLALFMALSVSSRYAILSIIVLVFLFVSLRLIAKIQVSAFVSVVAIALPLLTIAALETPLVRDALQLDDIDRGVGSGATGRLDLIRDNFFPQLASRPLTGFGFRQTEEYYTAHNAYLNVLLENGLIIGTMILVYLFAKYLRLTFVILSNRTKTGFLFTEQRMVFSIYSVVLFSGVFMPQIINFGDAYGIFAIFCLTYPLTNPLNNRS